MSKSVTEIKNAMRASILNDLRDYLESKGNDVLTISNTEICFPIVLEDSTEAFSTVKVSIPKGSKNEAFDGYVAAENFRIDTERKMKEKAERKTKAEKEKAERKTKAEKEKAEVKAEKE